MIVMMMMIMMMMIITSAKVREYPAKRAAAVREIAPGSAVSCNSAFHHYLFIIIFDDYHFDDFLCDDDNV